MNLPDKPRGQYGFDYPQREVEVDLEGATITTTVPDTSRLRPCKGYLKAIVAKRMASPI